MTVFRITTLQWSRSLTASGNAASWNTRGRYVIYTAESRSLACLENLVHRSGEGNNQLYRVMVIDIPDRTSIETLPGSSLKKGWHRIENYPYCQDIGATWLNNLSAAVLKVPSVLISKEHNYLLNPHHPDFRDIKLITTEDFEFDRRF